MKRYFLLFTSVLAAALALLSDDAWSRDAQKVHRIGVLQIGKPRPPAESSVATVAPTPANAFTWSLAKHGYVEGRNLAIERRWGEYEHLPALAAELEKLKVEVIGV